MFTPLSLPTVLCLLLSFNITSQITKTYSTTVIDLPSKNRVILPSTFGTSTLSGNGNSIQNELIDSILLVYTDNKNNPNFNQKRLNKNRVSQLTKYYPNLNINSINLSYVSQTGFNTTQEAKNLFHGFVIYLKQKQITTVTNTKAKDSITKNTNSKKHDVVTPYTLEKSCNVFFSGLLVSDHADSDKTGNWNTWNSQFFIEDDYSESVKSGNYPDAKKAFPKANKATFDGIAINQGTRLIIFKHKNFEGDTIIDIEGPAIINNIIYRGYYPDKKWRKRAYNKYYNDRFPPSTRKWSKTDMTKWGLGSLQIICSED